MKNKRPVKRSIISVVVAAIILLILGIVVVNRAFDYEYNQQKDYQYAFNSDHASIFKIELKGNKIELPAVKSKLVTAFIELEIKSTLGGFLTQPEIGIKANGITTFRHFG
jgi:amino acid transporter